MLLTGSSLPFIASLIAVALPTWITASAPPVFALGNHAAALGGWGLLLTVVAACRAARADGESRLGYGLLAALAVPVVLAAASLVAVWHGAPSTLALTRIGLLVAAALAALAGSAVGGMNPGSRRCFGEAFLWALLVAGSVNAAIGWVQLAAPGWADGTLIAGLRADMRAAGNLGQPNFLATQLVWAIVAAVALSELRRLSFAALVAVTMALLPTIVLTGSRIGLLTAALLAFWGISDRRLSQRTRWLLASIPLLLLLLWTAIRALSTGGGPRGLAEMNVASGRWPMWLDALQLIARDPWWGVGIGEFNFAWTLTPSPRRAHETFTHAHNLFLQWGVELGLPITLALTGLLGFALRQAFRGACAASGDDGVLRRSALALITVVLLHSQTEFPLWYAYFLLPAAFALGIALAPTRHGAVALNLDQRLPGSGRRWSAEAAGLAMGGPLLMLSAAIALHEYRPVAAIQEPTTSDDELMRRIAEGRQSTLFGHHADRFAGTLALRGQRRLEPYKRVVHEMLDTRLLIAWSQALAENKEVERARFVAARVAEFDDPAARLFFSVCHQRPPFELPFQCTPPTREFSFRDFRSMASPPG